MRVNGELQSDVAAVQSIAAVTHILDVVCRMTGMGFAAVARVTEDRWVACQLVDAIEFGLKAGGELDVETTICQEVRACQQPIVINHVAENEHYAEHPVPAMYGFQSYISMPIILPDGRFFGTLCAIDPRPARVETPEIVGMFKLFAELIGFHLAAQDALAASAADLNDERKTAEIREQFIAVLGHDLRNPLSAISAGASMLTRLNLEQNAAEIVKLMLGTVARMNGLVENMLDFARGRLGDGVQLQLESGRSLETTLQQVVSELTTIFPAGSLIADGALPCR
jgi:GAF domain-containing protein